MASEGDITGETNGCGAMQRDPSSHSLIGPRGLGSVIDQFLPSMLGHHESPNPSWGGSNSDSNAPPHRNRSSSHWCVLPESPLGERWATRTNPRRRAARTRMRLTQTLPRPSRSAFRRPTRGSDHQLEVEWPETPAHMPVPWWPAISG